MNKNGKRRRLWILNQQMKQRRIFCAGSFFISLSLSLLLSPLSSSLSLSPSLASFFISLSLSPSLASFFCLKTWSFLVLILWQLQFDHQYLLDVNFHYIQSKSCVHERSSTWLQTKYLFSNRSFSCCLKTSLFSGCFFSWKKKKEVREELFLRRRKRCKKRMNNSRFFWL